MAQTLLVTGGAGFIGSNFVRHALAGDAATRVVNLDKLTYAGNPATVADLEGTDPRYTFVRGDITDAALVGGLLAEHGVTAVVHFAAESHVDRSIDSPEDFLVTNVLGTFRLLECARVYWKSLPAGAGGGVPLPARLHGRGVRHAPGGGPGLHRGNRLRAQQPLRRQQGGQRPLCPRLLPHLRAAGADHELLQQLRAAPVSRRS